MQQSSFITKCDRLLLQSASGIIKCNSYYKLRRDSVPLIKTYFFCSAFQIKISVLNLNDGFSISFVDFGIYRKFPANNYFLKVNKRINKKRYIWNILKETATLVFSSRHFLLKVSNRNIRKRREICSKLTINTREWRQVSFWALYY